MAFNFLHWFKRIKTVFKHARISELRFLYDIEYESDRSNISTDISNDMEIGI